MAKTSVRKLYPLTEAGGSVVGGVLAHAMDSSTVKMSPPPILPLFLPVSIPPLPLPPIPAPCTPSTQRRPPGVRHTTRSHSTGEKADLSWEKMV